MEGAAEVGMPLLSGVIRSEFRMQLRRPAVWVVMLFALAATVIGTRQPWHVVLPLGSPPWRYAAEWAVAVQLLSPAAFGCLLADRITREQRLHVQELMGSLPFRHGAALLGKYAGAAAATAVPIIAVYLLGTVYLAAVHGVAILVWAVPAFAVVNIPGLVFVASFSLGCPAVMPAALYQFLFVGYWFWGNFLSPGIGIPTIARTVLTPVGGYAASMFGVAGPLPIRATAAQAWASIAVLLALAALTLWLTIRLRAWQAARAPTRASDRPRRPREAGPARLERIRYEIRIIGPGVLLTPLLIVAVFDSLALLTLITGGGRTGTLDARIATAALEIGLSLGAGLAAANLVASEPVAELHLSLPSGYRRAALMRLGIFVSATCVLGAVLTLVMAATGLLLSSEPLALSQLVWFSPVLWMAALGALVALVTRSRAGSVGILAGVWLVEFIAHQLFRVTPWLRPVFLFATSFARGARWWPANRLDLLVTALLVFPVVWRLLASGEAFVGHAQE